jgi:glycosyltransferase involved in cell wall biosynthesis
MTSDQINKVLIVAYHFPPSAAVGALRPQKFAKYLPGFGWEPHVLTIHEKFNEKLDPERLNDVKHVNILRTDFWRSPLSLFLDIKAKIKYKFQVMSVGGIPQEEIPRGFPTKKNFNVMFKHYLWEINTFPDASFYWTFPAVFAGFRLVRQKNISCIFATIPQPTAALVGYFISILTKTPLVLDFRDPWAGARFPGDWRSSVYDKLEAWVERLTICRAFRVICTNDRFKNQLRENYPDLPPKKFITIANGYDAEDSVTLPELPQKERFVISYLGNFYMDRNPESFFLAVQAGLADGSIPVNGLEIRLLGQVEYAGKSTTRELANACGLKDIVNIIGQVPHRTALQQMVESDLLLLLAPNQPNQIPGKAFEYIGARRPILALTEDGATADLIRETKAGLVVRQDDQVSILRALIEMIKTNRTEEEYWYQTLDIAKYGRRELTGDLAVVLDNAICSGKN